MTFNQFTSVGSPSTADGTTMLVCAGTTSDVWRFPNARYEIENLYMRASSAATRWRKVGLTDIGGVTVLTLTTVSIPA